MTLQKFEIPAPGGQHLAALLDLPVDGAPIAYALFAHCFTCSKDLKAVYHISRTLTRERIGVLRFDFTGLGESGGDFGDTSLLSNVQDLLAAAEFLAARFEAPQLLIGHSFGGAAVLQAAAIPSCRAVVTIAAPADPRHVSKTLGPAAEAIAARGEAEVSIAGRPFTLRRKFLEDLEGIDPESVIRRLDRALLVLHSPLDDVVGIENASRIFQAARHPKSFVSLDQADHLLSDPADSRYAGAVIAAWARRYLAPARSADAERPAADNRITARTGPPGGLATEILVNRHSLVADEPVSAGGSDQGPSPFDLLVAALGACTAMTLRMYADRKGWPLDAATVRLRHQKIHAADCSACETREGMLDRIEREIEIEGPLGPDEKQRLLQIADRCPVHRTLTSEVEIRTRLES